MVSGFQNFIRELATSSGRLSGEKMEGLITYLGFMGVIVILTKALFQVRRANGIEVEKSVETPVENAKPGQGYWDYLLVTGVGALVLIVIFLTSI
jgi:hypothetical protein